MRLPYSFPPVCSSFFPPVQPSWLRRPNQKGWGGEVRSVSSAVLLAEAQSAVRVSA